MHAQRKDVICHAQTHLKVGSHKRNTKLCKHIGICTLWGTEFKDDQKLVKNLKEIDTLHTQDIIFILAPVCPHNLVTLGLHQIQHI